MLCFLCQDLEQLRRATDQQTKVCLLWKVLSLSGRLPTKPPGKIKRWRLTTVLCRAKMSNDYDWRPQYLHMFSAFKNNNNKQRLFLYISCQQVRKCAKVSASRVVSEEKNCMESGEYPFNWQDKLSASPGRDEGRVCLWVTWRTGWTVCAIQEA